MRTLVAVVSCSADEPYRKAIRETWLPTVQSGSLDVVFFMGMGAVSSLPDEVVLECRDDYEGLPNKVQEIVRWAYVHGYDFVMKLDNDVVLLPNSWAISGFEHFDFVGGAEPACKPGEIQTPFGFAYVLSRRAMELVLSAPLPGNVGSTHPLGTGNDEAWISTVLYINHIYLHGDLRYFLHRGLSQIRKPVPGHPRAIRRDKQRPMLPTPVGGTFAWCMYLNQSGWHQTPVEEILKEFHRVWESVKK